MHIVAVACGSIESRGTGRVGRGGSEGAVPESEAELLLDPIKPALHEGVYAALEGLEERRHRKRGKEVGKL